MWICGDVHSGLDNIQWVPELAVSDHPGTEIALFASESEATEGKVVHNQNLSHAVSQLQINLTD